jgi:hypothetical protein
VEATVHREVARLQTEGDVVVDGQDSESETFGR